MNWNDVKKIIRKEVLKEATTVNAGNTKFNLRTGVNKNPTKLGLKIQFEPLAGGLEPDTKSKLEVALQEKLNVSLQQYDIQVSKDTDVPRPEVIGFFIPLAQLKNLIVKSLTGQKVDAPDIKAPEPEGDVEELNEQLLREMRVRDLNEISKVEKNSTNTIEDYSQSVLNKKITTDNAQLSPGKKRMLEFLNKNSK